MSRYDEIINLKNYKSEFRRKMTPAERAAQFAPFAALSGFEGEILEESRAVGRRIELDEYEIEKINLILSELLSEPRPRDVRISYFLPDDKKLGGEYLSVTDKIRQVDEYEGLLITASGLKIPLSDLMNIEEI